MFVKSILPGIQIATFDIFEQKRIGISIIKKVFVSF